MCLEKADELCPEEVSGGGGVTMEGGVGAIPPGCLSMWEGEGRFSNTAAAEGGVYHAS